jgi:hypothetical protein
MALPLGQDNEAQAAMKAPEDFAALQLETSWANVRQAGTALYVYLYDHGECPAPGPDFVPVAEVRDQLEPTYIANLPANDGWGNAILYRCDGNTFFLASNGSDRQADGPYDQVSERTLTTDPAADLIWRDKGFLQVPERLNKKGRPAMKRHKGTMKAIRSAGTAVVAYGIDHDGYPGPTNGTVKASFLRDYVEPTYIANLPANDNWGHEILYWSDGTSFRLISHGADGSVDGEYDRLAQGEAKEPTADIVYADGRFIRWPAGAR